jgi:hypothetical protein
MWRLGAHQPAADAQGGEICLVAGALGKLGDPPDQTFGVERGADDGLGVQIDDGTLLLGTDQTGKVARSSGVMLIIGMPTRTDPKLFAILAGYAPLADDSASSNAASSLRITQR